MLDRGPIGQRYIHGWLEGLLRANRFSHCHGWLRRNASRLKANTELWGSVGWAWTAVRDWKQACRWNATWRDHPQAEPWMLVNVTESFRARKRDAEAIEVSQHAVSIQTGHGHHLHHLWLASDRLLAGDVQDAATHFAAHLGVEELDRDYQFLCDVVEVGLEAAQTDPVPERSAFLVLRQRLNQLANAYRYMEVEPARARTYLRIARYVARCEGALTAKLWSLWQIVRRNRW